LSSITGAQTDITVNAAPTSRLIFTAGEDQSFDEGVVSPTAIVIQPQDAYGNPFSQLLLKLLLVCRKIKKN
jgi:hypothetical protein